MGTIPLYVIEKLPSAYQSHHYEALREERLWGPFRRGDEPMASEEDYAPDDQLSFLGSPTPSPMEDISTIPTPPTLTRRRPRREDLNEGIEEDPRPRTWQRTRNVLSASSSGSSGSSLTLTDGRTSESQEETPGEILETERNELSDKNPVESLKKMSDFFNSFQELLGVTHQDRGDEQEVWLLASDSQKWYTRFLELFKDRANTCPSLIHIPKVKIRGSRALDYGGVLREVLTCVVDTFLKREYIESGDNGNTFSQDTFSLSDEYLSEIHTMGEVLATYTFFYQEVPWPHQMDITLFMASYKKSIEEPWAAPGSTVGGVVGKALEYLEELKVKGGAVIPLQEIPDVLRDVLENETRAVKVATLAKLRTPAGCDQTRIKLYQKYTIGSERMEVINAFGKGLNVLGLFQRLKNEGIPDNLLTEYLQRSGEPTAVLMGSLLDISKDQYAHDPLELATAERLGRIFTYWMQTDRATPERLQFIHRETTGSNRSCGHRLSLSFFRHCDGYMAFNTCFREISLNLCIVEEIDEAEEVDHDDEANYLDLLIGDEMVQYKNSTNAFTTV